MAGLHVSVVHTLLSLQTTAVPGWQLPPPQVSPVVQALPSLHGAVLFVCWQPPRASQLSLVHGFPSSQLSGVPAPHVPLLQTSCPLHTVPSSQGAVLLTCWQPRTASQLSVVHTLPSPQFSGAPACHVPLLHTSWPLQTVPSSQEAVLFV